MNNSATGVVTNQSQASLALWVLLLVFAAANILPVFPHAFPRPLMAAGQIIPAALFALVHGALAYRLRGILSFAVASLGVGYVMETLGVFTGFPFGRHYFTDGMGPKLLGVPILMGPAYLGMGYVSWTMARVILNSGASEDKLVGARVVTVPLAATFFMVAWDLSFDPALSTYGRYWIWPKGGAYFGVPVSNFLGWFLTNYLIYQLFVLYQRRRSAVAPHLREVDARLAVIFYAVCAGGCVLRAASIASPAVVADSSGALWRVSDINSACALSALFTMGAFVALAFTRLGRRLPALKLDTSHRRNDRVQVSEAVFAEQDKIGQKP